MEELLVATWDIDSSVREAAARILGQVGLSNPTLAQEGILNVLLQPLKDPDTIAVIRTALRKISSHAPSEPVLQAMYELYSKQEDNWRASVAAEGLAAQGERIPVSELRQTLHSDDRSLCWLALTALEGAGEAAPVDEIIALLDDRKDQRYAAMRTLCALWKHVPGEIFLRMVREEQNQERGSTEAVHALIRQGEPVPLDMLIWAFTRAQGFIERQDLVEYLTTLDDIPPALSEELLAGVALSLIGSPADYRHLKKEAFQALVPRFHLKALQTMLQHKDEKVRRGGLLLLQYHPEEIPQEALVMLLSDSSSEVRQAVLARLRTHSAPLPVLLLRPLLDDSVICASVILTLGKAGIDAPLNDVLPFFGSTNPGVRAAVLKALHQPGLLERTPLTFFLNATGDANEGVRDEALQGLKNKDTDMAITCCLDALSNTTSSYRTRGPLAFQILQEIHPAILPEIVHEASTLLQGGEPGRFFRSLSLSCMAEAMGEAKQATPELLARLSELLDWPHWEVRMKTAQALGKLRRNVPDAAIRRLLELRHDPSSRAVRETVDEALAEILSLETGIEDD